MTTADSPPPRAQLSQVSSETIHRLAASLARAQGEIENASKDRENPHFKARYADLASVRDACAKPLAENGLSVVQLPSAAGGSVTVRTILMHESGEWIASELSCAASVARSGGDGGAATSPQALGSAITYLRRYSLAAMVGVAPGDDDDGEAAEGRGPAAPSRQAPAARSESSRREPVAPPAPTALPPMTRTPPPVAEIPEAQRIAYWQQEFASMRAMTDFNVLRRDFMATEPTEINGTQNGVRIAMREPYEAALKRIKEAEGTGK